MDSDKNGILYLVATPIGNLEDITFRAVRILKEADLICTEDTRTSGKLLSHYDIHTSLTSYHEHNKFEKIDYIISKLEKGNNIALITDAGTPGISDPGEELVAACIEKDIEVLSIPGSCAFVCAVTSSGISSRRFCFEAFLPKKKKLRQQVLEEISKETRTIIIYEAPHRLKDTLKELSKYVGIDRRISICRELTKKYEEKLLMTMKEALSYYENVEPRGEFILIIEGKTFEEAEKEKAESFKDISIKEHMERYLKDGTDRKEAMKLVAKDRGIPKREVYAALNK